MSGAARGGRSVAEENGNARPTDEGSEGAGARRARAPFLLRRVLHRGVRLGLLNRRRDVLLVRRRGSGRGGDARRHGVRVHVASPSRHLRGLGTDEIDRPTTRRTRARARTTPDARRDPGAIPTPPRARVATVRIGARACVTRDSARTRPSAPRARQSCRSSRDPSPDKRSQRILVTSRGRFGV